MIFVVLEFFFSLLVLVMRFWKLFVFAQYKLMNSRNLSIFIDHENNRNIDIYIFYDRFSN